MSYLICIQNMQTLKTVVHKLHYSICHVEEYFVWTNKLCT